MSRIFVDKEELIRLIDEDIATHDELTGYVFNGLYTGYDPEGCNWNASYLRTKINEGGSTTQKIREIIYDYQKIYNVFTGV